jgi:uncharacterized protein
MSGVYTTMPRPSFSPESALILLSVLAIRNLHFHITRMIKRLMEQTVRSALEAFPVVALLGPRQVGKTTLALAVAGSSERASLYLDLERDSDRNKLTDAELYLSQQGQKLVIFDEVQRRPELFPLLAAWSMSAFGQANGLVTFSC